VEKIVDNFLINFISFQQSIPTNECSFKAGVPKLGSVAPFLGFRGKQKKQKSYQLK
jgi:hypothetical protein